MLQTARCLYHKCLPVRCEAHDSHTPRECTKRLHREHTSKSNAHTLTHTHTRHTPHAKTRTNTRVLANKYMGELVGWRGDREHGQPKRTSKLVLFLCWFRIWDVSVWCDLNCVLVLPYKDVYGRLHKLVAIGTKWTGFLAQCTIDWQFLCSI